VRRAASLVALVCLLLAQGCPDGPSSASREKTRTLRVFAAASLSAPLDEIARAFEARNAGVRVLVNAASSSALERQLENGASCDLLIAATALAHGYDVLTENVREFGRVPLLGVRRPTWPS